MSSHKFQTTLVTVNTETDYEEKDFIVEFDFQPAEEPDYPREAYGYPGCPSSLEVTCVTDKDGKEVEESFYKEKKEELEDECWNYLEREFN